MRLLFLLAEGGEEHAAAFLGVPIWIWQIVNLAGFLAVLMYFVARPLAKGFRKRQQEVEERNRQAQEQRAEAARLDAQIRERLARLETELAEIAARGVAEGQTERDALLARADREAERVRREATDEIARRLADAKDDLTRTAAELVASAARELVVGEITDEDRRRLLEESVARLEAGQ